MKDHGRSSLTTLEKGVGAPGKSALPGMGTRAFAGEAFRFPQVE
jgi:hypothetical protein